MEGPFSKQVCFLVLAVVVLAGCASKPKVVKWQYTTLGNINLIDWEHDPQVQRLQRAGWSVWHVEDSPAWAGGVDRPSGPYLVLRREVPQ